MLAASLSTSRVCTTMLQSFSSASAAFQSWDFGQIPSVLTSVASTHYVTAKAHLTPAYFCLCITKYLPVLQTLPVCGLQQLYVCVAASLVTASVAVHRKGNHSEDNSMTHCTFTQSTLDTNGMLRVDDLWRCYSSTLDQETCAHNQCKSADYQPSQLCSSHYCTENIAGRLTAAQAGTVAILDCSSLAT